MKLANYRSGMLRFSVSLVLISIVILSNLFFYNSAQGITNNNNETAYFTEPDATISGIIFDNSIEVHTCFNCFEKTICNGSENPDLLENELPKDLEYNSSVENKYESFEIVQKSDGLHIAHYLMNCALKIPFTLI